MQHSVDSFTGAAQAAQEGLQLDQAADARGFCEPHAPPHSPKGPDRALGQQSLGFHRHSWLGMAGLFTPSGGARELRRKCIHFCPLVEPLLRWTKQGKGSCFCLFLTIAVRPVTYLYLTGLPFSSIKRGAGYPPDTLEL